MMADQPYMPNLPDPKYSRGFLTSVYQKALPRYTDLLKRLKQQGLL